MITIVPSSPAAIQIIELVLSWLETAEAIKNYYIVKDATHGARVQIVATFDHLIQDLKKLHDLVRDRRLKSEETAIFHTIQSILSPSESAFGELRVELDHVKKIPHQNLETKSTDTGKRCLYPLRQSTIQKLNEIVDECRYDLSLAIDALCDTTAQHQPTDSDDLQVIMRMNKAASLASPGAELFWFDAPDTTVDYFAAVNKRHSGSGAWLIESELFISWLEQPNSLVWLSGPAGAGKTILCSTVIESVHRHQRSNNQSAFVFFFFKFNDPRKQDVVAFLQSLLLQLSDQVPDTRQDLTRLNGTYWRYEPRPPLLPLLLKCLQDAISRIHHFYIILDGLDECSEDANSHTVLDLIEKIRKWSSPAIHMFVTSCRQDRIQASLLADERAIIEIETDNNKPDISGWLSSQFEKDVGLRGWRTCHGMHSHDVIVKDFAVASKGSFLLAQHQLERFRSFPKSTRNYFSSHQILPSDLDKVYETLLCSIPEHIHNQVHQLLAFLCLSFRPLAVDEAIDAIAVELYPDTGKFDPNKRLRDLQELVKLCPGLVQGNRITVSHRSKEFWEYKREIIGSENSDVDVDIIEFVHFSVKEFLMSDRILRSAARRFAVIAPDGHFAISRSCLVYLLNPEFLNEPLNKSLLIKYPLARFAAHYWPEHLQRCEEEAKSRLARLFNPVLMKQGTLQRIYRLYDLMEVRSAIWSTRISLDTEEDTLSSPIWYAASLGLNHFLRYAVAELDHIELYLGDRGKGGTPLCAAAAGGYQECVEILLLAGADPDAKSGSDDDTPLKEAILNGHRDVVRLLLDKGADVNVTTEQGRHGSALVAAASQGDEVLVKMLLDAGVDVRAGPSGMHQSTPLAMAAFRGYERIVQILLDAGAEVNVTIGAMMSTPLHAASYGGHIKIVQKLLAAGAEVDDRVIPGRETELCLAVRAGHEDVVRLLIEAHSEVNSAVISAAQSGNIKIMQMLLQAGACVDPYPGDETSALSDASRAGHNEIVKILIDAKADIEARRGAELPSDSPYSFILDWRPDVASTPLQAASRQGHRSTVKLLLQAGANVNAEPSSDSGTALMAASSIGSVELMKILLSAGANVNTTRTTRLGRSSALFEAASPGSTTTRGHEQAVKLLLDHNADVNNVISDSFGTILHAACLNGNTCIVSLLLSVGADIHKSVKFFRMMSHYYGTALHAASSTDNVENVQLLLAAGADVNAEYNEYGTALIVAAKEGQAEVVKFLLDAGAHVRSTARYAGHSFFMNDDRGPPVNALQAAQQKLAYLVTSMSSQDYRRFDDYYRQERQRYENVVKVLLDAGAGDDGSDGANPDNATPNNETER